MAITKEEVAYVAGLAKIGMTDQDVEKYTQDLGGILNWMQALKNIPVPDDMPVYHQPCTKAERADDHPTSDQSQQLMTNAPDPVHNFFGVPKVIE